MGLGMGMWSTASHLERREDQLSVQPHSHAHSGVTPQEPEDVTSDGVHMFRQRRQGQPDHPGQTVESPTEDLDVGGGEGLHQQRDKGIQHLEVFRVRGAEFPMLESTMKQLGQSKNATKG